MRKKKRSDGNIAIAVAFFLSGCSLVSPPSTSEYEYAGIGANETTTEILPIDGEQIAFVNRYYIPLTGAPFCGVCPPPATQSWIALQTTDQLKAMGSAIMPEGTYTYVLIPLMAYYKEVDGVAPEGLITRSKILIDAIKKKVPEAENSLSVSTVPFSLFLVPRDSTTGDYGGELARSIFLSITQAIYVEGSDIDFGMSTGPLLVSMNKPHFELEAGDPILWVDFENTPTSSIEQIVGEFRRRIETEPITDSESFEGFIVNFLEFIGNLSTAVDAVYAAKEKLGKKPNLEEKVQ